MGAYRTPATRDEDEAASVCGICGGEPHDIYECSKLKAAEAQRYARMAQRFAMFAFGFAMLNMLGQLFHLAFRYHWWGLGE